MADPATTSVPHGSFPPTLWTQILQAQRGDTVSRREALDQLIGVYWRPIYASIRFGWNRNSENSKDLTQDFFTDLLESEFWEEIDRSRGRFRSFLKAALKHFMLNKVRDRDRQKRRGDRACLSLDQIEDFERPAYSGRSPEDILDQEWVATVLGRGLERLQAEFSRQGKPKHYEILRRYDLEPSPPSYGELARQLGISESDVRNHLHEARLKLRTLVVGVVREYSADSLDLQDEIRFVLG